MSKQPDGQPLSSRDRRTPTGPARQDLIEDPATILAHQFLNFVHQTLQERGLTDLTMGDHLVEMEYDPSNIAGSLQQVWNARATTWAAFESQVNYVMTMQALISFLNRGKGRQRIASLGSGPGLYETFLGGLWQDRWGPASLELHALDYAPQMTELHKQILQSAVFGPKKQRIRVVKPITGDMSHLAYSDRYFDQIICNNSLQWVPNWKKAVAEMARVMNPKGVAYLYLVINNNPMVIKDAQTDTVLLEQNAIEQPELFDELERNNFALIHTRQIITKEGLGQAGGHADRLFILAHFRPNTPFTSWRTINPIFSGSLFHVQEKHEK